MSQEVEMTAMTHPAGRSSHRHSHRVTTSALVILFWIIAATLVAAARMAIEPRWERVGAMTPIALLLLTAWAYTRLVARRAGVSHAIGVGITWLLLTIAAEVVLTAFFGEGRYPLLGSPEQPLLRNALLFAWIFSPALFARGG